MRVVGADHDLVVGAVAPPQLRPQDLARGRVGGGQQHHRSRHVHGRPLPGGTLIDGHHATRARAGRARGYQPGVSRQVGARRHPRTAPRPAEAGERDQRLHPAAVRPPRLEELASSSSSMAVPGHRPADVLGHVVVAERDRVGVAERPLPHLGAGPLADARAGCAAAGRPPSAGTVAVRSSVRPRARPSRPPATGPGRCAASATPRTGWCAASRRPAGPTARGRAPGPGARSPYRWTRRRNPAKASWPVTFCSMIAGTSASITSPVRPSRQWRVVPPGLRQERVARLEPARVVVGAEQPGHRLERPVGARAPRRGVDRAVARPGVDQQGGRALRGPEPAPVAARKSIR